MEKILLSEKGKDFYINGEKIIILSGAIHYFRVVPEYWRDRLIKLKNAGFNTVETYVPWNLHEPREGEFNFEGLANFEKFLEICKELDLYVIFRATPYICAEWDFGGLPYWLLKDKNIKLRCNDPLFLGKVRSYFEELLPRVIPFLGKNGGPIIAMQVENEYGSYGNDTDYLRAIKAMMIELGMDTYWFTSDGPTDYMLGGGTIPDGTLKTINYGSRTDESFELLKKHQQDRPEMVMEYWIGWFDHWGNDHIVRDCDSVIEEFEVMLNRGASVNYYMFHGGTNFAMYNGANFYDGVYHPTATSYDYDALLTEDGKSTEKLERVKKVIEDRFGKVEEMATEEIATYAYGRVELTEKTSLYTNFDKFPAEVSSPTPLTMEELDVDYGFVHYETILRGPFEKSELTIEGLKDRALIYFNGEFVGIKERNKDSKIELELVEAENKLEILVENLGRINYGFEVGEYKGITGHVRLERQIQFAWKMKPLPMTKLPKLIYDNKNFDRSGYYKGSFEVDKIGDTFVRVEGFKKGMIYVNGFNLGRFWERGPQKTLYLPGPILKEGVNEIVIFAVEGTEGYVELVDKADLGVKKYAGELG